MTQPLIQHLSSGGLKLIADGGLTKVREILVLADDADEEFTEVTSKTSHLETENLKILLDLIESIISYRNASEELIRRNEVVNYQ